MTSSRSRPGSARRGAGRSGRDGRHHAPRSAPVEATARAVNVDELKPWSIVDTRYCSSARACSAGGSCPVSIQRWLAAQPRSARGGTGVWPSRRRCNAQASVGVTAHRYSASARRWPGRGRSGRRPRAVPASDSAVHGASMGGAMTAMSEQGHDRLGQLAQRPYLLDEGGALRHGRRQPASMRSRHTSSSGRLRARLDREYWR